MRSQPALRSRSTGPSSFSAPAPNPAKLGRRSERWIPSGGFDELFLKPGMKRGIVQTTSLRLREDRKQRIDARLHGTLPQQIGAETMNGADLRFFQSAKRVVEPLALLRAWQPPLRAILRASSRSLSFSSPAAFSVNVTETISVTSARPVSITRTMRLTSSVVLPVPAAASTIECVVESVRDEIAIVLVGKRRFLCFHGRFLHGPPEFDRSAISLVDLRLARRS